MGQGKITAPLSANVNVLYAFHHLPACWYHANITFWRKEQSGKRKVRCGKQKVEPLIYPDPWLMKKKLMIVANMFGFISVQQGLAHLSVLSEGR
jgi:hypothetical protein